MTAIKAHETISLNSFEDLTTFQFVATSSNKKVGPIPVTTTSINTCPDACPFKGKGCYAENGRLGWNWKKVSAGERGSTLPDFCEKISGLSADTLWRHNQAGDLPGDGDAIDKPALLKIAAANVGRKGFTYTHKPVADDTPIQRENRLAIAEANRLGFTINLSSNNPKHADKLADIGCGPVVTVLPAGFIGNAATTPAGRPIVVCRAALDEEMTCSTCRRCQKQGDRPIVGFPFV